MTDHVRILGWLDLAFAALNLALGALLFLVLALAVPAARELGSQRAEAVVAVWRPISGAAAAYLVLSSVPGVPAGLGLLRSRPWAPPLAHAFAVLQLLNFPGGTVLTGYSFWVLRQPDVRERFSRQRGL